MNKYFSSKNMLLLALLVLGLCLRFYNFGSVPISLNRDEAALLYNAYTIARFGVDEWNESYPFLFESFGDYKLPGYIYTTALLVHIFDLENWVVRLPSLLSGIGIIGITYLFGIRLFSKEAGLLAAAVVSLSPWAIFYSRMAWEANVGLFWLLITLYLFMVGVRWWQTGLAGISYILAIMTYNTPLLLAPILVGFCILLPKKTRQWKLGSSGLLVIISLAFWLMLAPLTAQKQGITIFTDPTIKAFQMERYVQADTVLERVRDHQLTNWVGIMLVSLAASFGPQFLVVSGGAHPWHSIPGRGHQMLTVYLGFMVSVYFIVQDSWGKKRNWWAWWWLLIGSLLPAIITVDAPHATRSLLFLWLMGLFSVYVVDRIKKILPLIAVGLGIEAVIFTQGYFWYMPQHQSPSWTRGLTEAVVAASRVTRGEIAVTNSPGTEADLMAEQAYIYAVLGLVQVGDPKPVLHVVGRDNAGLNLVDKVGRVVLFNDKKLVKDGTVIIERGSDGKYELQQ